MESDCIEFCALENERLCKKESLCKIGALLNSCPIWTPKENLNESKGHKMKNMLEVIPLFQ